MKRILGSIVATFLLAAPAAYATSHGSTKSADAAHGAMTDGEVRKVDKAQGKMTLKHGEIKNLDMPPMTMVFRVKDATLLDKVKEGDKIKFAAEKIEGNITITQIDAAGQKQ